MLKLLKLQNILNVAFLHRLLSDGFSAFLMAEEYEDAIMLVESSMVTLEVLDDKSLYDLASKKVEKAVNSQLDLFEKRFVLIPFVLPFLS